jgi:hypothetical protein
LIYTLHRFAVTAAGQRLVFDKKALADTLDEERIGSFRALIDLDDAARSRIGRKVMAKMKMTRSGWLARKNPSIGRLRPSMR